ncbi:unnamed protein product, partial [Effrenium voratum]
HVPGEHERNSFETMLLSTYICTCVCTYLEVQQCINIRTPRLPPHFFSSPSPTACSGACQAIAEALKINRTIVLIELDLNDIADAGAEALRKVVAEKKAQGLDLEIKL